MAYPNYVVHGTAGGENELQLTIEVSINTMDASDSELASALKDALNAITGQTDATVTKNSLAATSL